jgi:hypothetical protein
MRALRALLPLAALLLAACAPMVMVVPGPAAVRDDFTVTVDSAWNRLTFPGIVFAAPGASEIWTAEGIPLDVLAFYIGVREGDPLGRVLERGAKPLQPYRTAMTPHEIVELYEQLVTQDGSAFKLGRLTPHRFGSADGFRFEYALTRKHDGLALSGVAYGAVVGKRLTLMAFSAPRMHYFAKYLPRVEAMASSAQIKY